MFSTNLIADASTDDKINQLPRGDFAGFLKSSGEACTLSIKPTYDNHDKYLTALIKIEDQKISASLSGYGVLTKFIKLSESTSLIRSTYSWAECCHSGSRDEVYLEIIEDKISSVRIENFEDVTKDGKLSNITEEKMADETCVLAESVSI